MARTKQTARDSTAPKPTTAKKKCYQKYTEYVQKIKKIHELIKQNTILKIKSQYEKKEITNIQQNELILLAMFKYDFAIFNIRYLTGEIKKKYKSEFEEYVIKGNHELKRLIQFNEKTEMYELINDKIDLIDDEQQSTSGNTNNINNDINFDNTSHQMH